MEWVVVKSKFQVFLVPHYRAFQIPVKYVNTCTISVPHTSTKLGPSLLRGNVNHDNSEHPPSRNTLIYTFIRSQLRIIKT